MFQSQDEDFVKCPSDRDFIPNSWEVCCTIRYVSGGHLGNRVQLLMLWKTTVISQPRSSKGKMHVALPPSRFHRLNVNS